MKEKKYPEAQQELLTAVRLKPDLAEAYGNLAVVAASNKDYILALQALDDAGEVSAGDSCHIFLARHHV